MSGNALFGSSDASSGPLDATLQQSGFTPPSDDPSTDVQGAMNDATQQVAQSPDTPVPTVQTQADGPPEAKAKPSMWKEILSGALNGLANSAGAKHFGEGVALGAQGVAQAKQLQTANQIKMAQVKSLTQFRDAHAAAFAADAALKDQKRVLMPEQLQQKMDLAGQQYVETMGKQGIKPLRVIDNTSEAANAAMEDIAKNTPDGKLPPVYTAHIKGPAGQEQIAIYDLDAAGSSNPEAMRQIVNNAAPVFGVPSVAPEVWKTLSNTQRNKMFAKASDLFNPSAETDGSKLQGQIENYKAYADNAKRAGLDPDQVTQLNKSLSMLQAASEHSQQQKLELGKARGEANQDSKVLPVTKPDGTQGFAHAGDAVKNGDVPANQSPDRWVPNATSDEKKKAELAENMAKNGNDVKEILARRPDLVGAVAGRFTSVEQMIGNNDKDISALGNHIHNMAMANSGVHGFRSNEGVKSTEQQLLNNFKNGGKAVGGAVDANVGSVQTFIDNARPETYATHTKNGGAAASFPHTVYAQAPGKPRMKSTDGGKTWQTAQ